MILADERVFFLDDVSAAAACFSLSEKLAARHRTSDNPTRQPSNTGLIFIMSMTSCQNAQSLPRGSPILVWQNSHFQFKRSAFDNFRMSNPGPAYWFAIQLGRLHVDVLIGGVARGDGELTAGVKFRIKLNGRLFHERAAN